MKHKHQPLEYPAWRYHKDHEPVMLKSDEEFEALPGHPDEWFDNPTVVGVKMEVYEASGGQQKVRRVRDAGVVAKPEEHKDQDFIIKPEENLAEASEERLREILAGHGFPAKKLARKSKEQLLAMIAS